VPRDDSDRCARRQQTAAKDCARATRPKKQAHTTRRRLQPNDVSAEPGPNGANDHRALRCEVDKTPGDARPRLAVGRPRARRRWRPDGLPREKKERAWPRSRGTAPDSEGFVWRRPTTRTQATTGGLSIRFHNIDDELTECPRPRWHCGAPLASKRPQKDLAVATTLKNGLHSARAVRQRIAVDQSLAETFHKRRCSRLHLNAAGPGDPRNRAD